MKPRLIYCLAALSKSVLCVMFLMNGLPLSGQTTSDQEEVYELSPFEVSTGSETGYLATQTLSGTRLRSELGDVAASIEVLTEEFLRDVGATDMYDALDFVGNVDTWGKSGGLDENENQVWFSNPYMARGFLTSATTSDFLNMGKRPLDFYNKTNFTVARGPNAILFGIGSPGGIVNVSRIRPLWGKDLTDIQLRVDNYGSFRSTFDWNKEVIEDKLAVRAAVVYDDREEFLKPAKFTRKGYYGTLNYRPFKSTSVTITGETGTEDRVFRYTTTSYDAITPWINAGSPIFQGTAGDDIDDSFGSGLDREQKMALMISGQPGLPVMNWQNMARSERFEIAGHPDNGRIRATGYTGNNAIWDYDSVQLTGSSRQRELDWDDLTIFLTQELFVPELQLELAYNKSKTQYLLLNTFGQFYVQMDANALLPNGQPNPNLGVPYVESDRTEVIAEGNDEDTLRATLSYTLDLNDKKFLGIGLGRYVFMGLYEDNQVDTLFAGFRRTMVQNLDGFPGTNWLNGQNRVRSRTYLATTLTPQGAAVEPYYKPDFRSINENGLQDAWIRHTSPRDIIDTRDSYVLALQGYFWQTDEGYDRVIVTAGYRNDKQTSQRKSYGRGPERAFEGALWSGDPFNLDAATRKNLWDGTLNYGSYGDRAVTDEPTRSYSAVFKPTKDFSIFYNYSDVLISASSLNTDIYDNFVEGTIGETQDFGIRWQLFEQKLVASLTFFDTSAQNQRENNVRNIFTPEMNAIWEVVDPDGQIHKGFNERYVTLRDDTSDGIEFSLIANLTPGWTSRLSISQIETIIDTRLPIVDRYIAEFSPLWESNRSLSLSEDVAVDPDYLTVGDAIDQIRREIADLHALEGTVPNAQREWKVVFNTNYNFSDGALDGFGIGGGVFWQSKDIIGYAYDDNFIVDPQKPFHGEDLFDVSANFSYTTTLWGTSVRFQFNVRNLFDDDGTFARNAVDDLTGKPYFGRQQVREPRSYFFTTTIKF